MKLFTGAHQRTVFASWFSIDLQSARIVWFERERKSRRTQSLSVQIVCNSYEDPNVDDMKQNSTIEMNWKIVELVPQVQFLIEWWTCQLIDGVRISVSRHNDSQVQKIGAQDQYIGEIVCIAGSKID